MLLVSVVSVLFYYLIKLFYCLSSVFPNIRYYYVQIEFSSSLPMFMHLIGFSYLIALAHILRIIAKSSRVSGFLCLIHGLS